MELLAKNSEKGSTPSLAISCLTLCRAGRLALVAQYHWYELAGSFTSRSSKSHDDDIPEDGEGNYA